MGVAEEEHDITSMTEMVAAPEPTHKMAVTVEPDRKIADAKMPRHVTAANPESGQDTAYGVILLPNVESAFL